MAAYKSKTLRIRDALISTLQAVQYDAGQGSEAAFELVTADPASEFDQEPTCLVLPGPLDDVGSAVAQRDYTNNFVIVTVLSLENKQRTQLQTQDYLLNLNELAMNALDEADQQDALNQADPTLGTWILECSRSTPQRANSSSGAVMFCTIDVAVKYSKDL